MRHTNPSDLSKWAIAFRREMQTTIGQQLRCELPQEMAPELAVLLTLLRREDGVQATDRPRPVVRTSLTPTEGCHDLDFH